MLQRNEYQQKDRISLLITEKQKDLFGGIVHTMLRLIKTLLGVEMQTHGYGMLQQLEFLQGRDLLQELLFLLQVQDTILTMVM